MSSPDQPLRSAPLDASPGNILVVGSGSIDYENPYTELWMPDGQVVRVSTTLLGSPTAPDSSAQEASSSDAALEPASETIPLIEERLLVTKRTVTTGTVRLLKSVQTYQEALDEPLAVRTFDIDRVVLNQVVENLPSVRQEGDTTVYPVVEERMVLTKQLVLREEVRVTKRETEKRDTQVVTLRREHFSVEREPVSAEREPVKVVQP